MFEGELYLGVTTDVEEELYLGVISNVWWRIIQKKYPTTTTNKSPSLLLQH